MTLSVTFSSNIQILKAQDTHMGTLHRFRIISALVQLHDNSSIQEFVLGVCLLNFYVACLIDAETLGCLQYNKQ